MRKVEKRDITEWMTDEELYGINVDNAFDLLSTSGNGKFADDMLELNIDVFRQYSSRSEDLLSDLCAYVDKHRKLSQDTFEAMWKSGTFDDAGKLFISYIIDERISAFGDRWLADQQIHDIKCWESKYDLYDTLSANYGSCLSLFIQNRIVYESSWTSYGNPREYSLCKSLKNHLFTQGFRYADELMLVKQNYTIGLPF